MLDNLTGHIMSGDTPVARFDGRRVTPIRPDLAPLCFQRGGDLEDWLEHRAIDRHRTHSRVLKHVLRVSDTSDLNTVMHVHGVSITDNYWVKPDNENLTWNQVGFSTDYFANVALRCHVDDFTRSFSVDEIRTPTPELTNTGSFEKCWRLIDGTWTMLKASTPEARFSEIFISRLCREMGLPTAEYYDKDGYTATPDFTQGQTNFEPMRNLVGDDVDYDRSYEALEHLGHGLEYQYLDIIFMDALILNPDRHTENYGILRDRRTGEIRAMAPNFDNNLALISNGYTRDGRVPANILIRDFHDLLRTQNARYEYPTLPNESTLREIIRDTATGLDIDQEYVVNMVQTNYANLVGTSLERVKQHDSTRPVTDPESINPRTEQPTRRPKPTASPPISPRRQALMNRTDRDASQIMTADDIHDKEYDD